MIDQAKLIGPARANRGAVIAISSATFCGIAPFSQKA